MDSQQHQPWDRLPNESLRAFAAFREYRDLRDERSIGKVVQELKKSPALIYRWSARYQWQSRIAAYEEFQDQILQREMLRQRIKLNQSSLAIAESLTEKVGEGVAALRTVRKAKDGEGQRLAVSILDLLRMLESSRRIQQDILGDAKEDTISDIHVHFTNYEDDRDVPQTPIDDDEEEPLE